jgi:hypothetical protein
VCDVCILTDTSQTLSTAFERVVKYSFPITSLTSYANAPSEFQ